MSTGPTGTAGATAGSPMHQLDRWLLMLFVLAIVAYTVVLGIFEYNDTYTIDWAAFFVFVIIGSAAFIGGYLLIRKTESHPGQWSLGETGGVIACVAGALLLVNGAMPQTVSSTIEKMARPIQDLSDLDQPTLDVKRDVNVDASEKIDIISINGTDKPTINGNEVTIPGNPKKRVFLFLEVDPSKTTVAVPQGAHGKVWYELGERKSKADTF